MPAIGACWAVDSWLDTTWALNAWADVAAGLPFIEDLNTRCHVYLCDLYGMPGTTDAATLVQRYVNSQTGEMNTRLAKLIRDATEAMT